MNEADVSKQIQQMVRFIRQEAEEKANEISVSAEEEFNIEKLQLVEAEKKKIRQQFEHKAKQVEVRKKIEYSMQLNAARIRYLQAQDDMVNSLKASASRELMRISDDKKGYRSLLKCLIVQGKDEFRELRKSLCRCTDTQKYEFWSLLRLKEPAVLLRCREADRKIVEAIMDEAKQEYADKSKLKPPRVTIDGRVYLPPAPSNPDSPEPFCSGGVVVASQDGKIVLENTLDLRLDVVFRQKLPEIRKRLLGSSSA